MVSPRKICGEHFANRNEHPMKQRFSKRTRLVSALLTLDMVFTFLPFSAFAAGG